ncbi:hypothetical protein [Sorangium sp. So ce176]
MIEHLEALIDNHLDRRSYGVSPDQRTVRSSRVPALHRARTRAAPTS